MGAERWRAVVGSVVVHLVLVAILLFTMWERPPPPAVAENQPLIQARAVDEATALEPVRRREAEEQRKKEALAAEKKRQAEEQQKKAAAEKKRQLEAQQKKAEAEKQRQLAEQKKKAEAEQQRQSELKRKQEAVKAEEETKRLAAEQRKREAAEKLRADEARKRKEAEDSLKAAMAAEDARLADEARQQRSQRLKHMEQQYISDIRNKVTRNWLRPPGSTGTLCGVLINQIPGGEITGVRVTDCDGDIAFERSVEAAVNKSSPLPLPSDPELFQREIEFVFRP
ncbi:MAG: cell envelope integrity protein TolA [Gammaproteobacteria bacterium]|nr:cell envelope integrity protein TolA [Gammaproteobacteria bacterium]